MSKVVDLELYKEAKELHEIVSVLENGNNVPSLSDVYNFIANDQQE